VNQIEEKSVLIIDDDVDIREFIATALSEFGFITYTAEDGLAGLTSFQSNSIDMVITDIYMPKMNGIELIQKLHRMNPDVKILAMSGDARNYNHEALNWAEAAGAFEVIDKPFELTQLIEMINMMLSE